MSGRDDRGDEERPAAPGRARPVLSEGSMDAPRPAALPPERHPRLLRALGIACLVAAAVALIAPGCGEDAARPPGAPTSGPPGGSNGAAPYVRPHAAPHPGFVGVAVCETCHASQTEKWRASHHARAMAPADATNVLGDFGGASVDLAGTRMAFSKKGDRYVLTETAADGTPRDYDVAYTFGFFPLQQFLLDVGDGRLQAHTAAWDSRPKPHGGQRWYSLHGKDVVKPSNPLHWAGDFQNWNFMCAECHSTDLVKGYDAATGRYATSWAEIDVACEACHGPGERHVAWAREREANPPPPGETAASAGADPRLDVRFPRELEAEAWAFEKGSVTAQRVLPGVHRPEIETCARCHSRRAPNREGYAFGRPLADSYDVTLLDPELYHADGQILDEVYEYGSFLQSKMYRRGVTCSSCHDAHSGQLALPGNDLCTRCHDKETFDAPAHHRHSQGSDAAKCVECHMVSRKYMGVDERRDHSFRVPRPDLTIETGSPNACNDCHRDESAAWAADAIRKWFGEKSRLGSFHYGKAIAAARDAKPGAARLLLRAASDEELAPMARASALVLLRGWMGPDAHAAVERAAADPSPLVRLAAARTIDALPPPLRLRLGLRLLADDIRGVRIDAAAALADIPPAALRAEDAAAIERGVAEHIEAQRVNLDRPEAHGNLGIIALARGDAAGAESAFRKALAMRPSFSRAAVNLAETLRRTGRAAEGEALLRDALPRATGADAAAELHGALGLFLVRRRDLPGALAELTKASELRPADAHAAYVLAVALHDTGDPRRALDVLRAAQTRRPADRELLTALATFSRTAADLPAAAAWARKLVDESLGDPAAAEMLATIERELAGRR